MFHKRHEEVTNLQVSSLFRLFHKCHEEVPTFNVDQLVGEDVRESILAPELVRIFCLAQAYHELVKVIGRATSYRAKVRGDTSWVILRSS